VRRMADDDLDQMGPIDYLVVEFPGSRMNGKMFPLLLDLVDRGLVRILDLAFIREAPPAQGGDMDDTLAQLKELGALKEQDVLTDAEFEVQKDKILHP
jgi:hypothetical protein